MKTGDGATQPQIRAHLVGGWFEGRRTGAASLLPWQMRHNLFGRGGGCGKRKVECGEVVVEDSRVRADGTRVPHMMVVPLEAFRLRYRTRSSSFCFVLFLTSIFPSRVFFSLFSFFLLFLFLCLSFIFIVLKHFFILHVLVFFFRSIFKDKSVCSSCVL